MYKRIRQFDCGVRLLLPISHIFCVFRNAIPFCSDPKFELHFIVNMFHITLAKHTCLTHYCIFFRKDDAWLLWI